MKKIIASYLCMLLCLASLNSNAQKFYTKTGKISFFSSTALENIEASNRSVTALLDSKTGELQFTVLVKGFEFKKALMQEHFNENYLETDKFPKASEPEAVERLGTTLENEIGKRFGTSPVTCDLIAYIGRGTKSQ